MEIQQELEKLVKQWRHSAMKQWECEADTDDPIGKASMWSSGMSLVNCICDIEDLLKEYRALSLPLVSSTQEQHQES